MKFRPCIDLKGGKIVQIVGGTLTSSEEAEENFVSSESSSFYAKLYERDSLKGGHVIMLGPGNEALATEALAAFPEGLQVGGGVTASNAQSWLEKGASHVIVTSFVFHDGRLDEKRLDELVEAVGRERLVLDLSCREQNGDYYVVTDRWQKFTDLKVNEETLTALSKRCAEFLVHGVDVEGKRLGVDANLVALLGAHATVPVTYAGGARSTADLELVKKIGNDRVDLTIGSALDIFGADLPYADVLRWHRSQSHPV